MNIAIDASDFAQLADFFRRAPEITQRELLTVMTDADVLLQGELMQQLPAGAAGAAGLRGSISHEEHALGDNVLGLVASSKDYAWYVEGGTKPHRPPIQPLMDWVEAKLGLREEEAKGVAFAISRTIAKRGTKANPVWSRVWQAQQATIRAKFVAALERITVRLAAGGAA